MVVFVGTVVVVIVLIGSFACLGARLGLGAGFGLGTALRAALSTLARFRLGSRALA